MSGLNWAAVCVPDDPAYAAWTSAAKAADAPAPRFVSWSDVLDGTAAFSTGELVHAERLTPMTPARYGGSRARYERFAAALDTLHTSLAEAGATATTRAADTLLALDRLRCAEHLTAAGVPVAEPGGGAVRQRFAEPRDAISHVSERVETTLALVRTRTGFELRNTLRTQYHYGPNDDRINRNVAIVGEILARDDETFAVADLPTVFLRDDRHRFRFAVVDGEVTHAAGRLVDALPAREYYGGRRREIDEYRDRFGVPAWQRLIEIAGQAAAAFPAVRSLGVEIATNPISGHDAVYDVDPFGAYLPAALGLPGTAGAGLEVRATALRSWMAR